LPSSYKFSNSKLLPLSFLYKVVFASRTGTAQHLPIWIRDQGHEVSKSIVSGGKVASFRKRPQARPDTLYQSVLARKSPERHQIRQIVKSIQEFGFTNPIIVDGQNTIVAGHGRLRAA
jgi:predicted transcriptional regulator